MEENVLELETTDLGIRRCLKCRKVLDAAASRRRTYCSDNCRKAAAKRRGRGATISDPIGDADLVSQLEAEVRQLSSSLARSRSANHQLKLRSERAEYAANQAAVSAEESIKVHAGMVRELTARLSHVEGEQLEAATAFRALRQENKRLRQVAGNGLPLPPAKLVRQWAYLVAYLVRTAKGRPLDAVEQEIVTGYRQFRQRAAAAKEQAK